MFMLINFTNHPSENWQENQLSAAKKYGEITDISFPPINPLATKEEISTLAQDYAKRIITLSPTAVLCQGEFTFVFAIVTELKKAGVQVLAACSERCVSQQIEDGHTKKVIEFKFAQFREY